MSTPPAGRPPCATCAARERVTYVRDDGLGWAEKTLGLTQVEGDLWACPACDGRYRCEHIEATRFHDYDEWYWTKLDPPAPPREVQVRRCPKCGSTSAGVDEDRPVLASTYMKCDGCGHGGLHDSWERDFDGFVEIERPDGAAVPARLAPLPPIGCADCFGADAGKAWTASQERRRSTPVQEPHFSVHLTQCACGQRFATVFTERIDWANGEDDQTWLVVHVGEEETKRIEQAWEAVEEIARGRRFLVRSFPPGGALSAWWRDGGFAIGPHD